MSEEEKKAIEKLRDWKDYNIRNKNILLQANEIIKVQETILNLIEKLQKENEILKEEKSQAWEEWNNLEQGSYETEQKLKQQIKELQKENDELKKQRNIEPILINNKMYFIDNEIYNELLEDIKSNYTSVQKIKDKIEELEEKYKKALEKNSVNTFILKCKIMTLQELIEESEKK